MFAKADPSAYTEEAIAASKGLNGSNGSTNGHAAHPANGHSANGVSAHGANGHSHGANGKLTNGNTNGKKVLACTLHAAIASWLRAEKTNPLQQSATWLSTHAMRMGRFAPAAGCPATAAWRQQRARSRAIARTS